MSESTVYSRVQTPVTLKNRKARLLCQKHLKGACTVLENLFLGTDETRMNLYQNDGRETGNDLKHATSSVNMLCQH